MCRIVIDLPREMLKEGEVLIRIAEDTQGGVTAIVDGDEKKSTSGKCGVSFREYMERRVKYMKAMERERSGETSELAKISFLEYRHGKDIDMADITSGIMEEYQDFLKIKGLCLNTISFYMRILRAAYNKAVKEGLIRDRKPFVRVYTGKAKTEKRAVNIDTIKKMVEADLDNPKLRMAIDMFLFSFYTHGMSFVDIAHLKKSDIRDGLLIYKRRKTWQTLTMEWLPEMQEIVDHYPSKDGEHLLGLLDNNKPNGLRRQLHSLQTSINKCLAKVSSELQLSKKITMYVARHSWATIARDGNVPLPIISQALGHTSESTTRIYLKEVDSTEVDHYNSHIIKRVMNRISH